MGMELAAAAAVTSAGLNAYSGWQDRRQTNKQNKANRAMVQPYLNQGPSAGENQLLQFLGGGMNMGQDGIMQGLRSDSMGRAYGTLNNIMDTGGNPYDTSNLFEMLNTLDTRKQREGLADTRSQAGGLGQRFGTANAAAEGNFLQQMVENAGARNQQIGMQSHEAAQGRRLGAVQGLGDLERLGQMDKSLMLQGLSQLMGAEGNRRGMDTNLLGMLMGIQPNQGYNFGGDMGSIANFLLMQNMIKDGNTNAGGNTRTGGRNG